MYHYCNCREKFCHVSKKYKRHSSFAALRFRTFLGTVAVRKWLKRAHLRTHGMFGGKTDVSNCSHLPCHHHRRRRRHCQLVCRAFTIHFCHERTEPTRYRGVAFATLGFDGSQRWIRRKAFACQVSDGLRIRSETEAKERTVANETLPG